jgi:polysaccharide export outer membrane protein
VQLPTVSIALLAAGGVTRDADIRNVVLKRSNPTGNSPTVVINLWDSLFSENTPRDLVLQDGDALFVPKLAAGDSLDRRLVARSSFAPRTVRVRVVGEVKNPGELEIPPNSSLSSAVAIAGGPTDKAKLSNVRFVRMNEDGILEEQSVDLSNLTDSYQIQEGDVIVVPKSNTYTALDIASDLFNPLNLILNLFK